MSGKLQGLLDLGETNLDAMTLHLVEPGAQDIACDGMTSVILDDWEHRS